MWISIGSGGPAQGSRPDFEHGAIRLGLVHTRKGKYVRDETLSRRRKQNRHNRAILEHCIATNELGQEYTLQQLAELSVSNSKIRQAELMTVLMGSMRWCNR